MTQAIGAPAPAGKGVIAGTVVLGSFVSVMDVSIVNVAMPQMLGRFGVTLDAITRVAVAYSIAAIILVTMSAWCSVWLGRKRFYVVDHLTPYQPWVRQALDGLSDRLGQGSEPSGVVTDGALKLLSGVVRRQATMMAYNDVFWMMGMLFVLGLSFLLLMGGRAPRAGITRPPTTRS
jgi:hypothetical protein